MEEVALFSKGTKFPTRKSLLDQHEVETSLSRLANRLPVAYVANYVREYLLDTTAGLQLMTFGHLTCGTKIGVLIRGIKIYVDLFPIEIIKMGYGEKEKQVLLEMDREGVSDPATAHKRMKSFDVFERFKKKVSSFGRNSNCCGQDIIYKKIFNAGVQPTFPGYRVYYKNAKSLREAMYTNGNVNSAYMQEEFFTASYSKTGIADLVGAREDKYFGSWMALNKYEILNDYKKFSTKLEYNLVVNIDNYAKITDADYKRLGVTREKLNIYKSLHLSIDIETADLGKYEDVKSENNNKNILSESNIVFNIGCVIASEHNMKPLLRINIINTECDELTISKVYKRLAVPGQATVVTRNQKETLEAFIMLMKSIMPDFVYGYNSLDFDIPQIVIALRCNNLFDKFYSEVSLARSDSAQSYKNCYTLTRGSRSTEYCYNNSGYTYWCNLKTTPMVSGISGSHKDRDVRLKFSDGKLSNLKIGTMMKSYHEIDIPGIIMLDVMLISWKQYPGDNAKGGMNYYLQKNKLKVKLDVPYYKIWLFYSMTADYDIEALPRKCKELKEYYLGDREINKAVYKALEGKSLLENIRIIVEYCSYDAEAAMLLMDKYSFMGAKRKFCELVNLPLYKVIYRADGSKVENSLRRTLVKNNYVSIEDCLNLSNTDGYSSIRLKNIIQRNPNILLYHVKQKAPVNTGGRVKIYVRGKIKADFVVDGQVYRFPVPIDALDFASLYPSLMMAFNLCCTTIVFDTNVVEYYRKHYPEIRIHELPARDLVAESGQPEDMNKYYSEYYKVESFKDSTIYILQHSGDVSKYGMFAKNMGQFFTARSDTKTVMNNAKEYADEIVEARIKEQEFIDLYNNTKDCKLNIREYAELYSRDNDSDYMRHLITHANANLEQNCVKVVMNTVYGTLDYIDNYNYSPLIASIITYYGRLYLKHSNKFCIENGRTPVYNDTDSTYYYHPLEVFQSTVERYVRGQITKSDFKRRMVCKSMKNSFDSYTLTKFYNDKIEAITKSSDFPSSTTQNKIERLKAKVADVKAKGDRFADLINKSFAEKSQGKFLKQVREETLYPAVFCMLKKYFGLVHTTKFIETYSLNNVLFRGIKIRVANATRFEKDFIWSIIKRIIDEDTEIRDIVYDQLNITFNSKVDYKDLTLYENTSRYKSKRGRADIVGMIRRFERTREYVDDPKLKYLLRTPFELENVYYVFVKNAVPYTITGNINKPKKQDLNEYSEVVKYIHEKNSRLGLPYMEIDIERYVVSTAATCAQFLSYDLSYGFEAGMLNKDYVKKIASEVTKYCKNHYKSIEVANADEIKNYRKFITKTDALDRVILEYGGIELRNALTRMIKLSTKLRYSEKIDAMAECGHIDLGVFHDGFVNDSLLKVADRTIDEEYISNIEHIYNLAKAEFDSIRNFIDVTRDRIISQLFDYLKREFRGEQFEVQKIDIVLAEQLLACEEIILHYIGCTTVLNGVNRHYWMNKPIVFDSPL